MHQTANSQNEQKIFSMFLSPKKHQLDMRRPQEEKEVLPEKASHRYQPPRVEIMDKVNQETFTNRKILNHLQNEVGQIDVDNQETREKQLSNIQPLQEKLQCVNTFQKKAIRRTDNDLQVFQQIFVNPKQQQLEEINSQRDETKQRNLENLLLKQEKKRKEKKAAEEENRKLMSMSL